MAKPCVICNKKTLLNSLCKCGDTVCLEHRYSDKHCCTFDYKNEQRKKIARENPLVKKEKIATI